MKRINRWTRYIQASCFAHNILTSFHQRVSHPRKYLCISGFNRGGKYCECLGVIIEYSRSSAPMVWTRHNENINMHGRDTVWYRKPARPLVPTCVHVAHARQVRSGEYYARIYTFSVSPPESLACYAVPTLRARRRGNASNPSDHPSNRPFSDEANPTIIRIHPLLRSCISLPVVSLPLFRTSLTCSEQHRLRRL